MLRLSRMTDYGVVVMSQLARHPGRMQTALEIADQTGLPDATVAKLLKILARAKLVQSQRGAAGGYALRSDPAAIAVSAIIDSLEGGLVLVACVDGAAGACGVARSCPLHGRWDAVNDAIRGALDRVTLADLIDGSVPDFASQEFGDVDGRQARISRKPGPMQVAG